MGDQGISRRRRARVRVLLPFRRLRASLQRGRGRVAPTARVRARSSCGLLGAAKEESGAATLVELGQHCRDGFEGVREAAKLDRARVNREDSEDRPPRAQIRCVVGKRALGLPDCAKSDDAKARSCRYRLPAPASRRRNPMRRLISVLTIAMLFAACGGDDAEPTDSANGSGGSRRGASRTRRRGQRRRGRVHQRPRRVLHRQPELIEVLDRYGGILDEDAVTVGDVRSGATEIQQSRSDVGESADVAVDAREELEAADEELVEAVAELDAARRADTSNTSTEPTGLGDGDHRYNRAPSSG